MAAVAESKGRGAALVMALYLPVSYTHLTLPTN